MKRNHLVFLLSLLSLNLFCQVHWTKYPDNPVMVPGAAGEWDDVHINSSEVIYKDSTYHMWYWSYGDYNFKIGHAISPDGLNWTKDTLHNPVLSPGQQGSWDGGAVNAPSVIYMDSIYHMWYTGYNSSIITRIGHATSTDGVNWTKDTNNPILEAGAAGSFESQMVGDGSVIHDGVKYHMIYAGANANRYKFGHATSPDGVIWTRDSLNPVLSANQDWEFNRIDFPEAVYDGTMFHLWYRGGKHYAGRIGYAASPDGSNWTKEPDNPVFGGFEGDWDDNSGTLAIIDSAQTKFKMWYGASTSGNTESSIGYAESDDFVYIPDTAFLFALIDEGVDTNEDSLISYVEAEAVTSLNYTFYHPRGEKGDITSLGGIQAFINLTTLQCDNHQLSNLDVSHNLALQELQCRENQLTSLDISDNPALRKVECSYNLLTSLDASNCTALESLICISNEISDLNVSNCLVLNELHISNNQLLQLDISSNKDLKYLYCSRNYSNNLSLGEICVWESFDPESLTEIHHDLGVCFETDCNGMCGSTEVEKFYQTEISIYPIPTNSLLNIETEQSDKYSIEITTLNGQLLYTVRMEGTSHQIDLSSFQKGVYFITIRSKDFVTTRKIIKL